MAHQEECRIGKSCKHFKNANFLVYKSNPFLVHYFVYVIFQSYRKERCRGEGRGETGIKRGMNE